MSTEELEHSITVLKDADLIKERPAAISDFSTLYLTANGLSAANALKDSSLTAKFSSQIDKRMNVTNARGCIAEWSTWPSGTSAATALAIAFRLSLRDRNLKRGEAASFVFYSTVLSIAFL
jgi:hypothetical protein